ncbi:unnamed protein product [Didymodactylos carnosus]|uniref:Uncharacterized protein n=1 Tax=Didymodactylos carnosus TaxID=1234261 RepID=A0A814EYP6_9BILA|nr:unnamed protein product [Didymodactylos carnosus]CAF3748659.1 unnamed protein product [Didymodactylos carnosus]
MSSVKNVAMGASATDPIVLATTGVASCIAVIITLKDKGVFINHVDSTELFNTKCSTIDNAQRFIERIVKRFFAKDKSRTIDSVYLIGGLDNNRYNCVRNSIEVLRLDHTVSPRFEDEITTAQVRSFLSCIKLNKVDFNLRKQRAGENIGESDDENASDSENDYVFDCTIICDRSIDPMLLAILQYAGTEGQLDASRRDITPFAVYQIDSITNIMKVYIDPTHYNLPFAVKIDAQILKNVGNSSLICPSGSDHELEKKLATLVARIKT